MIFHENDLNSIFLPGDEPGVAAAGALRDGGHVRPAEGARPAGDRQAQEQGWTGLFGQ